MIKEGIVSDAGPLIAFSRINQLSILTQLFHTITIPQKVSHECVEDLSRPGAKTIKQAILKKKITVSNKNIDFKNMSGIIDVLGEGEASAIKLALINQSLLLIDDKQGRSAAKKMQIKIIGTAGILLLAKKRKLVQKIFPIIDDLQNCGYRLSKELIQEVLKLAKEI